jgi:predicted PurR-regulated permease PerM
MNHITKQYLSHAIRFRETYWLITGAILGYVCFVSILGTSGLVIGVGGAIAFAMIATWFWNLNQTLSKSTQNLLERKVFLAQLSRLEQKIDQISQATWQQAYHWAEATQQFATQIAQQEPILIPELLEALHTVLNLTKQVVSALETVNKVKSHNYRLLANQKLEVSCLRLQQTHDELQQLQDQVLLSSLNHPHGDVNLPQSLQLLIAANKTAMQLDR